MTQVTAVLGNSSSGIVEAPSIPTATINIGDRQKEGFKQKVLSIAMHKEEIVSAFQKVKRKGPGKNKGCCKSLWKWHSFKPNHENI